MLRRLAKAGIAWGLSGTGADRLLAAFSGSSRRPLVVGYHRVVESFEASAGGVLPGMIISRSMLESQLDWLGQRFRFVSLGELGALLEAGTGFASPVAAVTFDDGYADVYEHALPLLRSKGIPAAVFVVTDVVASGALQLYDRLYILLSRVLSRPSAAEVDLMRLISDLELPLPAGLKREGAPADPFSALRALLASLPRADLARVASALERVSPIDEREFPELRPLSWEMVRALQRAGTTIGSHTCSHTVLTREDPSRVAAELSTSRSVLERQLGVAVEHLAYPDGGFDDLVVAAVARAGYRFAYTTCPHGDPRRPWLTISRRMLWQGSCLGGDGLSLAAVMSCQATGVFDYLSRCGHDHNPRRPLAAPEPVRAAVS